MRRLFLTTLAACALAAAALLLLGACKATDTAGNINAVQPQPNAPQANTAPPAQPAYNADAVRRVTIPELQKMLADGEAVVYDTRPKDQYDRGHIKDALSFPFADAANRAGELPKDKLLVFYCA